MRIYAIWLMVVAFVYRLCRRVERFDKDLARQMRRAVSSAALNIAEGKHGRGGNRIARYADALGSAQETRACLDVCIAAEFISAAAIAADMDRIDHVIASMYVLCYKRRA